MDIENTLDYLEILNEISQNKVIKCDVCGGHNSYLELDLNNNKCYNCDSLLGRFE